MGTVKSHVLKLYFPIWSPPASLRKADFSRIPNRPKGNYIQTWQNVVRGTLLFLSHLLKHERGNFWRNDEGIQKSLFPLLLHLYWQDLKQWSWRLAVIFVYVFETERAWAIPRSKGQRNWLFKVWLVSMLEIKHSNNYKWA